MAHEGPRLTAALAPSGGVVLVDSLVADVGLDKMPTLRCPHCSELVIPKRGDVTVWHFQHKLPGSSCFAAQRRRGASSALGLEAPVRAESEEHKAARWALVGQVEGLRLSAQPFVARWVCAACTRQQERTFNLTPEMSVCWERAIPGSRRRPDVSVWLGEECVAALEVYVTHEVEDAKWEALEERALPTFEASYVAIMGSKRRPAWDGRSPLRTREASPRFTCTCPGLRRAPPMPRNSSPLAVSLSGAVWPPPEEEPRVRGAPPRLGGPVSSGYGRSRVADRDHGRGYEHLLKPQPFEVLRTWWLSAHFTDGYTLGLILVLVAEHAGFLLELVLPEATPSKYADHFPLDPMKWPSWTKASDVLAEADALVADFLEAAAEGKPEVVSVTLRRPGGPPPEVWLWANRHSWRASAARWHPPGGW